MIGKGIIKLFLSILIFIVVFYFLGIFFKDWGFIIDDFGLVLYSKIKDFASFINLFKLNAFWAISPSSSVYSGTSNYLAVIYRPMVFVYLIPQVYLFGVNPFGYFLTIIFFHSLNTVFLFNLIYGFTSLALALTLSLYFAFHTSFMLWFGWISGQQYVFELSVLILIVMSLKKYLDSGVKFFYLLSCFFYLLNMWQREMMAIFPLWTMVAVYFYLSFSQKDKSTSWQKIKKSSLISIGYWVILFSYLIVRGLVFSFKINTTDKTLLSFELNWNSFISRIGERFWDFVTIVSDYLGLMALPHNNHLIKGIMILSILGVLFYLFLKNNKKPVCGMLIISSIMFSWIPILLTYQSRYIYVGLFFWIICIATLINFAKVKNVIKQIILACLAVAVFINFIVLTREMNERKDEYIFATNQIKSVSIDINKRLSILNKESICFFNLPHCFDFGTAQAIWLYTNRMGLPVYQYKDNAPNIPNSLFITWDYEKNKFIILN